MEAVSRGAHDAGGRAVGLTITLPHEQKTNPYVTDVVPFYFFFARQVAMCYTTEVVVFCPGGFGTLDELFEMLTLQQTGKLGKIPIILFGVDFWTPIFNSIKEVMLDKYHTVNEADMSIFTLTDDVDQIIKIISESRLRDGQDALS